jgi:hypothetical protein
MNPNKIISAVVLFMLFATGIPAFAQHRGGEWGGRGKAREAITQPQPHGSPQPLSTPQPVSHSQFQPNHAPTAQSQPQPLHPAQFQPQLGGPATSNITPAVQH